MKVKIYLNDWFFNLGLVGFLRILSSQGKDYYLEKNDNDIVIETEDLRQFPKWYFSYFFEEFRIVTKVRKRGEQLFKKCSSVSTKIADEMKKYKEYTKTELDKVKKLDNESYERMKVLLNSLLQIKEETQLEEAKTIIKEIESILEIKELDEKMTLNFFKNYLKTNFFGQCSFLNTPKNNLSYQEQMDLMYKDYISNIVESGVCHDIVEGKYTLDEIKKYIETLELESCSNEFVSYYRKIQNKYIEKGKTLEEIQGYIKSKILSYCQLCGEKTQMTMDYTEEHFIPLALSSKNALNFFYQQNVKFPICGICRLILFCTAAGVNKITKVERDFNQGNIVYKEKQIFNFINRDTDIESLERINQSFYIKSQNKDTLQDYYPSLMLTMIEEKKELTKWAINNILVVEFEANYDEKMSRIEYFHFPNYIVHFFQSNKVNLLKNIKNKNIKLKIIDCIMKNKSMNQLILDNTTNCLKKADAFSKAYDSVIAIEIQKILEKFKKGEENMEEINKKIEDIYEIGRSIHIAFMVEHKENQIMQYTYQLLNSIKSGDSDTFMDIIIRIHVSLNRDVSSLFLGAIQNSELGLEGIGHSFVAGLVSNRYDGKNENNKEEKEEL